GRNLQINKAEYKSPTDFEVEYDPKKENDHSQETTESHLRSRSDRLILVSTTNNTSGKGRRLAITYDLTWNRLPYMADLHWDRLSRQEPSGPRSRDLTTKSGPRNFMFRPDTWLISDGIGSGTRESVVQRTRPDSKPVTVNNIPRPT
ncbi:hypothetical protein AVEN_183584-1, partial [Araneus ventricosus]